MTNPPGRLDFIIAAPTLALCQHRSCCLSRRARLRTKASLLHRSDCAARGAVLREFCARDHATSHQTRRTAARSLKPFCVECVRLNVGGGGVAGPRPPPPSSRPRRGLPLQEGPTEPKRRISSIPGCRTIGIKAQCSCSHRTNGPSVGAHDRRYRAYATAATAADDDDDNE